MYRDFMMSIVRNLEPRIEKKDSTIFEELDDINEVVFIEEGQVEIGYELNKKKKYVLRYYGHTLIGAYNCTFNVRAIFCYRAKTDCTGFSIRKQIWMSILNDYDEIGNYVKDNVELDYFTKIKDKVMYHKNKHIESLNHR